MKTYEFTYVLVGKGETEDEALSDALEGFDQCQGDLPGFGKFCRDN